MFIDFRINLAQHPAAGFMHQIFWIVQTFIDKLQTAAKNALTIICLVSDQGNTAKTNDFKPSTRRTLNGGRPRFEKSTSTPFFLHTATPNFSQYPLCTASTKGNSFVGVTNRGRFSPLAIKLP